MADFIVLSSETAVASEGKLLVELKVTPINRKLTDKRIVLTNEGHDVEISIPLAEIDNFLADLIEARNKGFASGLPVPAGM